jgi:hypothetical protein
VAIQSRVVSRSGLDVASSCLMHVNRTYVFQGGSIDARRFFRIRNLTRKIEELQPKLTFRLQAGEKTSLIYKVNLCNSKRFVSTVIALSS